MGTGDCDAIWKNTGGKTSKRFVGDIEDYSLTIYHTMGVSEFGISESTESMRGFLKVGPVLSGEEPAPSQHELCRSRDDAVSQPWKGVPTDTAPCYIKTVSSPDGDTFQLSLLLDAMNVSLNDKGQADDESLRSQGFTVNIDVIYFNAWPWEGILPLKEVVYYYEICPRVHAKYERTSFSAINQKSINVKDRVVEVARGIFIHITGAGTLSVFSFQRLLVTLTTAVALMTAATVCVNWVARFLLRWGSYYSLLIYDTSGDFGRLHEISNMTDGELTERLVSAGQPTGGSREERILLLLESEDNQQQIGGFSKSPGSLSEPSGAGNVLSRGSPNSEELQEILLSPQLQGANEGTRLIVDPRKGSSSGTSYGT